MFIARRRSQEYVRLTRSAVEFKAAPGLPRFVIAYHDITSVAFPAPEFRLPRFLFFLYPQYLLQQFLARHYFRGERDLPPAVQITFRPRRWVWVPLIWRTGQLRVRVVSPDEMVGELERRRSAAEVEPG
jgi:hypothetical protein